MKNIINYWRKIYKNKNFNLFVCEQFFLEKSSAFKKKKHPAEVPQPFSLTSGRKNCSNLDVSLFFGLLPVVHYLQKQELYNITNYFTENGEEIIICFLEQKQYFQKKCVDSKASKKTIIKF